MPAKQGADAGDASAMELQRHPRAAHLVRAGTIDDHLPVAWNLVVTMLDFLHRQMDGARNEVRIEVQLRARPQINNDNLSPRHPACGAARRP